MREGVSMYKLSISISFLFASLLFLVVSQNYFIASQLEMYNLYQVTLSDKYHKTQVLNKLEDIEKISSDEIIISYTDTNNPSIKEYYYIDDNATKLQSINATGLLGSNYYKTYYFKDFKNFPLEEINQLFIYSTDDNFYKFEDSSVKSIDSLEKAPSDNNVYSHEMITFSIFLLFTIIGILSFFNYFNVKKKKSEIILRNNFYNTKKTIQKSLSKESDRYIYLNFLVMATLYFIIKVLFFNNFNYVLFILLGSIFVFLCKIILRITIKFNVKNSILDDYKGKRNFKFYFIVSIVAKIGITVFFVISLVSITNSIQIKSAEIDQFNTHSKINDFSKLSVFSFGKGDLLDSDKKNLANAYIDLQKNFNVYLNDVTSQDTSKDGAGSSCRTECIVTTNTYTFNENNIVSSGEKVVNEYANNVVTVYYNEGTEDIARKIVDYYDSISSFQVETTMIDEESEFTSYNLTEQALTQQKITNSIYVVIPFEKNQSENLIFWNYYSYLTDGSYIDINKEKLYFDILQNNHVSNIVGSIKISDVYQSMIENLKFSVTLYILNLVSMTLLFLMLIYFSILEYLNFYIYEITIKKINYVSYYNIFKNLLFILLLETLSSFAVLLLFFNVTGKVLFYPLIFMGINLIFSRIITGYCLKYRRINKTIKEHNA